jgi:hypothetical protein
MTFIHFFNQLKTTSIKRCTDCKHYLQTSPTSYANNRCTIVIYKCLDTCVNKYEYAYIARSNGQICGPKGSKFLQKDIKKYILL